MKWRVIVSPKLSSAENMAIDEAILLGIINKESPPTIRFYDWEPSTISYGLNQEVEKEIDFVALRKYGFGYVRRPTGGRMVLHDNEITYSIISPISGRFAGNILDSYAEISKALSEGLHLMGVNVTFEKGTLSADHQRQEANPCFSSSSRFELNYKKKKIVGSAQVRKKNVLLQHGSILLHFDQSKLAYLMPNISDTQKERLAKYLGKKTIAINQILEKKIDFSKAIAILLEGFQKKWCEDSFFNQKDISGTERKTADNLIKTKYLTDEWNRKK